MHDTKSITDAVKVLRETGTARLTRVKEFNNWLLDDFAPKCDTQTRKHLRSSLRTGGPKSKVKEGWEDAFRRDTWMKHSKTPGKSPNIRNYYKLMHDIFGLLNLVLRYMGFKQLEQLGQQGRRFTALLIWYQVYRELQIAGVEERLCTTERSDVVNALEKVALDHEVSVEDITKCRTEATGWMRFSRVFGPGAILLAGVNAIYSKNISEEDYVFMHTYCAASRTHVLKAAQGLDTIAENIVRKGLSVHGMSTSDFFEDADNHVARCLKSGTAAPSNVQEAVPVVNHEAPRLQELAEAARSLSSIERSQPQNAGIVSSTLYGATPNFMATNQYIGDGQMLQPQWQQYGEPSWQRQQTENALDSMYNASLGPLQQDVISTTNDTEGFPAQEWLDELCGDEGFLGGINH